MAGAAGSYVNGELGVTSEKNRHVSSHWFQRSSIYCVWKFTTRVKHIVEHVLGHKDGGLYSCPFRNDFLWIQALINHL